MPDTFIRLNKKIEAVFKHFKLNFETQKKTHVGNFTIYTFSSENPIVKSPTLLYTDPTIIIKIYIEKDTYNVSKIEIVYSYFNEKNLTYIDLNYILDFEGVVSSLKTEHLISIIENSNYLVDDRLLLWYS